MNTKENLVNVLTNTQNILNNYYEENKYNLIPIDTFCAISRNRVLLNVIEKYPFLSQSKRKEHVKGLFTARTELEGGFSEPWFGNAKSFPVLLANHIPESDIENLSNLIDRYCSEV